MARISVSLDEATAAALTQTVGQGGSVSKWVAGLIRDALLTRAATAAAAYDRDHGDAADEAARLGGLA
jgi:hypothetical protein